MCSRVNWWPRSGRELDFCMDCVHTEFLKHKLVMMQDASTHEFFSRHLLHKTVVLVLPTCGVAVYRSLSHTGCGGRQPCRPRPI